jgi:hypothetical protein
MKKTIFAVCMYFAQLLPYQPYFSAESVGVIEGKVTDIQTAAPLIGANIRLGSTTRGAVTNAEGRFLITGVPVGTHTINVSLIGYQSVVKTDLVVRPQRNTQATVELQELALKGEEVLVTAGYFNERGDQPISSINFSSEEVRRAPGSGGDISLIIHGLPSLAKVKSHCI